MRRAVRLAELVCLIAYLLLLSWSIGHDGIVF